MQNILNYIQIVLAVLLISSILLQHRGTSLGGAFGGEGNVYRSRRGAEKFLFWATIILAILFVVIMISLNPGFFLEDIGKIIKMLRLFITELSP